MTLSSSPVSRLPTARRDWARLLERRGVRPSKGMGQNFLVEPGIVQRIVRTAGVQPGDRVVEVGPGLGILTAHLLEAGARVDAIELDTQLAAHLRATFGDIASLAVHEADALVFDLGSAIASDEPYSVVANLPYSVASAVIMRFLESPHPPRRMTVMIQLEVAERLIAVPPQMSVLSVAAQVLSSPRIAFKVTPGNFMPPPKIDSAVVVIEPSPSRFADTSARARFFALVNAGFRHKRKQLVNSLEFETDVEKAAIIERLTDADVDPLRRAQTLAVSEWLRLFGIWEKRDAAA